MKKNKKLKLRTVLTAVLGIGLLAGAVALVSNLIKPKEEDNGLKEIHPTFEYGGLDESGNYVETKESLITKKAIEYNELKLSIDFDSNITYQLFYYDENDTFVSASEVLTKGTNETSDVVKYVRVLITPVLDEDVEDKEIKWYDVVKYTSQMTVKVYNEPEVEETSEVLSLTITGGFEDITIEFEEGMTWLQWIFSDYNQCGITIGGEGYGNTYIHLDGLGLESSSGLVSHNDVINPNETYMVSQ